MQTVQTMKKLTKIKLINWHYFQNETINVDGSFLLSGENASGKSTILDAIQLVLTTSTKSFNLATTVGEKRSKRDLKGYVRCKTGEEGNAYYRTGSVISLDMDPEEAKKHLMKIVFHMLEIANEIRIMSNAQIRRSGEGEQEFAERIEATEKYLTEKVANNIDKLLIEQTPRLDVKTSKELFGLLGGGVIMNGEYVPVEHSKVFEAIMAQTD